MRAIRCVVVCVLVFAVAAAAPAGENERLMKEVEAIGDALAKAMLEDDVDTMLGMYVEDAISLPNFSPRMDGIEAFRKSHDEMAAAGMKVISFTNEPTDVWEAGKQVIEIGKYTIALDMPGAPETINDKGKYMTVYVRGADGSLKIKAETWNTDMNPMEMGKPGEE
jgi:ketosteroid isomerase-like protein